jgi:hypothetical protein
MNKKLEIEKLMDEAYTESKKEQPDNEKIKRLRVKIFNLGIGLNFNDINK